MTQSLIISQPGVTPTVDQMVAGWLHAKTSLSHSPLLQLIYLDMSRYNLIYLDS